MTAIQNAGSKNRGGVFPARKKDGLLQTAERWTRSGNARDKIHGAI